METRKAPAHHPSTNTALFCATSEKGRSSTGQFPHCKLGWDQSLSPCACSLPKWVNHELVLSQEEKGLLAQARLPCSDGGRKDVMGMLLYSPDLSPSMGCQHLHSPISTSVPAQSRLQRQGCPFALWQAASMWLMSESTIL